MKPCLKNGNCRMMVVYALRRWGGQHRSLKSRLEAVEKYLPLTILVCFVMYNLCGIKGESLAWDRSREWACGLNR